MPQEGTPERPKTAIALDEFQRKDFEPQEYKIGDIVTRENFLSLLIQSFAVSRGASEVQNLFFTWLNKKFDFDASKTFEAFLENGCWDALTDDEKAIFMRAYDAVRMHSEKKEEIIIDGGIRDQLVDVSSSQIWNMTDSRNIVWEEVGSLDDFKDAVKDLIMRKRGNLE